MPPGRRFYRTLRKLEAQAAAEERLSKRLTAIDGTPINLPASGGRRQKYHAQKTVLNGETYDSLGEAECAAWLEQRRQAGDIVQWWRPEPFLLADRGCRGCGALPVAPCVDKRGQPNKGYHRVRHATTYKPDFGVIPSEPFGNPKALKQIHGTYYIDYKGSHVTETEAWRLKMHLWAKWVPHELRVVTRQRDGHYTERVVCDGWHESPTLA